MKISKNTKVVLSSLVMTVLISSVLVAGFWLVIALIKGNGHVDIAALIVPRIEERRKAELQQAELSLQQQEIGLLSGYECHKDFYISYSTASNEWRFDAPVVCGNYFKKGVIIYSN